MTEDDGCYYWIDDGTWEGFCRHQGCSCTYSEGGCPLEGDDDPFTDDMEPVLLSQDKEISSNLEECYNKNGAFEHKSMSEKKGNSDKARGDII